MKNLLVLSGVTLTLFLVGCGPDAGNTNHIPKATEQNITVLNNTTAPITLSGTDEDGDELTYSVTENPAHGTLSGTAPNVIYTPNSDFVGTDNFKFKAKDATAFSAEASILINVMNSKKTIMLSLKGTGTNWEPWITDGTSDHTHLLKDINPGQDPSLPDEADTMFVKIGSYFYFVADDGEHGEELWRSDGTADGTTMVKDLRAGRTGSYVKYLTNVNGTLFFRASVSNNEVGSELWKSDGTPDGTTMVKFFDYGPDQSYPYNLTAVGETLFFTGHDSTHKAELWKSNGTEDGTTMVKNIYTGDDTGDGSSLPANLIDVGGTLFFTAFDDNGTELWKSDGTATGTVMVKDIRFGSRGSDPAALTQVGNALFFRATSSASEGSELWKSDGSTAGTIMVKDILVGASSSSPSYLTDVNGTLFFRAYDDVNGTELWKSNGTEDGTVLVKDIYPGEDDSSPKSLVNANGKLLFVADDGVSGEELWTSDGTLGGTTMVKDIHPSGDAEIHIHGVLGSDVFFSATDDDGKKLWKSDASTSGTSVLVAEGLE